MTTCETTCEEKSNPELFDGKMSRLVVVCRKQIGESNAIVKNGFISVEPSGVQEAIL